MKMGMRMRRIVTFVQTQGRASATESNQTMQRAFLVAGRKDQFIFIDGKTFIFFLYGNAHEKDMSFRMSKMTKKNLWKENWLRELLKDLAHRLEWSQHLWKGSISSTSDSPAYKRHVKLADVAIFCGWKSCHFFRIDCGKSPVLWHWPQVWEEVSHVLANCNKWAEWIDTRLK